MPDRRLSILEAEPEPEVLAHYDRCIADRRRRMPQIFSARQPAPLPMVSGRYSLRPKEKFRELAAGWKLRDPADDVSGLIETHCIGDCLVPIMGHGDRFFFDPNSEPMPGDLVVVLTTVEQLQATINFHRKHAHHLATYGPLPSPFMCKLLTTCGSEYHAIEQGGGGLPLSYEAFQGRDNWICGVVRRIERGAGVGFGVGGAAA